jgi:hypothetical protein
VIAGDGDDDRAAQAHRRGGMLASDAERERVIETLKAAYVYGLVTKDEFEQRVNHTLASRTHADLALVTADIPYGLAAPPATLTPPPARARARVQAQAPAQAHPRAKAQPPATATLGLGERAVVVPAALAGLALIIAVVAGNSVAGQIALGAAAECALLSLLFLAVAQILGSRRVKRRRGQLPPGGAVNTVRSTGQPKGTGRPRRQGPAGSARSRSPRPRLST